jgi:hypothetical protein
MLELERHWVSLEADDEWKEPADSMTVLESQLLNKKGGLMVPTRGAD